MSKLLDSDSVHAQIDQLLLTGRAATASGAESMFLDEHLSDIINLALELDEASFARHEAVKLLFAHGSRPWEDELQ